MVDHIFTEVSRHDAFGERHTDRIAEPLPQWAGRCFNPGNMTIFRMAGR